ncbi:hypothetical protein [Spirosoma sp. KNUC1025]|uniref:hypothetical protein n=1 Tax=Spirosoma sp. KNUC1025 TaxID=2894082 RepID=UPI003867DADF|nr:hypothetical protein LN737_24770 [Spirosoma sp. KNUC1025]
MTHKTYPSIQDIMDKADAYRKQGLIPQQAIQRAIDWGIHQNRKQTPVAQKKSQTRCTCY